MDRNKQIIRVSIVGILANVLLAGFKALVGLLSGAIAIVMDAVNSLRDALSSVITIVGTKLSARPRDQKHPFGHGRVEYLSAIVISLIVFAAGITSLVESVKKIVHPSTPSYTTLTLIVIVVAIAVKLLLGLFVKRQGKSLKSDALIASGADALFDAIVTLSTLISAGIMLIWGVNLDGIFGTVISLVIIKAGVEMLASPLGELLGSRIPHELTQQIKDKALSFSPVHGVYDIIVNSYGPNTLIGSLHVSVDETMTARELHLLTRSMAEAFYRDFGIIMTIGIYAVYTGDTPEARLQQDVMNYLAQRPDVAQAHAFYYYADQHLVTIDIMPVDSVKDASAYAGTMNSDLQARFPDYRFNVVVDFNYS